MKLNLLFLTLIFQLPFSAQSEDKRPVVYAGIKEVKNNPEEKNGGTLQKLLSIQGVDTQYKACQAAGVSVEKLPICIWEGDNGNPPALSEDLKKKVSELYAQENSKDTTRAPASEKSSNLTNKSKNIAVDYMNDPAVVELSKVFQKKLEEALLGDVKAQADKTKIAVVDHSKFIELYKTELGKTIVNSFTSYCMESEIPANYKTTSLDCEDDQKNKIQCPLFIIGSDPASAIQRNMASLKTANLSTSTNSNPNPVSNTWTSCIASVSRVCYVDVANISPNVPSNLQKSKQKACTIMDYVKTARKNLIAADEQKSFYEDLAKNAASIGSIGAIANARQVVINEKNNMDAATTVTSKDIETSYEKKNKEVVEKEMEDCFDSNTQQIKDAERCKKFIETDPEEKKKALTEFSLRQYALGETMDKKLQDDEAVKKYLKEEGYDDKKIGEMTSSPQDIDKIRQEIKRRYENERKAIIATMADKIKAKTTSGDQIDRQNDSTKISVIRDEIAKRPDDLKQLVHFSNIVSSYLEIESKGEKTRNVASLYAEINNSASKIKDVDADAVKNLKQNAEQAGLKENKNKEDRGTNLGVDTLNGIFKYSTEK